MKYGFQIFFTLVLLQAVSAFAQDKEPAEQMKKIIAEIYNARNFELMGELVADDYVEFINGVRTNQDEAIKGTIFWLLKVAPDYSISVEDIITEGNKVVIRWLYRGTNELMNKEIELEGVFIGYFEQGKLKNGWQYFDNLSRFQQLGYTLVPPEDADVE